jgi:hypothetical protein
MRSGRVAFVLVRVVWLGLAVALLYLTVLRPNPPEDAFIVFGWGLIALAFPSVWLLFLVIGVVFWAAAKFFALDLYRGMVAATLLWGAVISVGYLQWFVWLPRSLQWAKARRQSARSS